MDTGNSGSTSSGDDEYDSRATINSSFNHPISPHPPTMFNPNFFINPQIQPQPNFTHHPNQINNPYSTPDSQTLPFPPHNFTENTAPFPRNGTGGEISIKPMDQVVQPVARNPKKRSRASRRAPTTVLTTDTTNFRAMVQEFTGIPTPPFTSTFPRSRFDLFGAPSSVRSNLKFSQTLLKPFPRNLQSQFSNHSELGLIKHLQHSQDNNLLNMQMRNPNHSFFHSSSSNSSIFESKTNQYSSTEIPSNIEPRVVFEESGLHDIVSPENGCNFVQNVSNQKH